MRLIWHTVLFLWLLEELGCQTLQDKSNTTGTEETDATQGYVVWNPSCRIPRFDPYDNSIKEYLIPVGKPKICSHLDPLTTVNFTSTTQRYTLKVNSNAVGKYWSTISALRCCYAEISRNLKSDGIHDTKYNLSQAVCFKNQTELPPKAESIFVYCTSKNRKIFKTVYFIPANKTEDKKPKPIASKSPNKKSYSVLLFGIGSMSRSNFVRTLPETKKLIEEQGWLPLEGYVKVGNDTFSNLIPILTGRSVDQLTKVCHFGKKVELDKCPFIWKNFSENGYLTSFTENSVSTVTFNQDKYKFSNSPTDFHSQPFLSAAEDLLQKKSEVDDYCLGQRPKVDYLFHFNAEFLQRFYKRPYFNLFWLNSLDCVNTSTSLDARVKTFLQDIEPYLNSTMVIFFSDQGQYFGDIRQTFVGWLEEQMPFLYFHLPPSLKSSNSKWFQNLLGNRNKLISPFDLHATLQKLVFGRVLSPLAGCSKCGSLFAPVQDNRTCSNAAIPATGCTCWISNSSNSVSNPRATVPAHQAVATINDYLQRKADKLKRGYRCAPLSLSQVTKVRSESVNGTSRNTIVFETKPKKAVFEITIPRDIVAVQNVAEIRRIDKGSNETSCIKNDNALKTFCFCTKK